MSRLLIFGIGLLSTIVGLSLVATVGGVGLWAVFFGLVLIIATTIERVRYRSTAAEPNAEAPGPGGGEPAGARLDARFRPTEERFVDPTTGVRMRVWIDPAVGERRYVAEE